MIQIKLNLFWESFDSVNIFCRIILDVKFSGLEDGSLELLYSHRDYSDKKSSHSWKIPPKIISCRVD